MFNSKPIQIPKPEPNLHSGYYESVLEPGKPQIGLKIKKNPSKSQRSTSSEAISSTLVKSKSIKQIEPMKNLNVLKELSKLQKKINGDVPEGNPPQLNLLNHK